MTVLKGGYAGHGETYMHPDDLAQYRRDNVPLYNGNRMKIGVFGLNVSGKPKSESRQAPSSRSRRMESLVVSCSAW